MIGSRVTISAEARASGGRSMEVASRSAASSFSPSSITRLNAASGAVRLGAVMFVNRIARRAAVKPRISLLFVAVFVAACSPFTVTPQSEHYMLRSEYYRAVEDAHRANEAEKETLRERYTAATTDLERTVAREEGRRMQVEGEFSRLRKHSDGLEARIADITAENEEMAKSSRREIESLLVSVDRLEKELTVTQKELNEMKAKEGRSTLLTDEIEFGTDSSTLSPEMKEKLRGMRSEIEKASSLSVIGYTDDIEGTTPKAKRSPWAIAAARAAVVVEFIQADLAIEGLDISAVSRGSRDPKDLAQTPGARARNRRVEIIAVER